MALRDRGRELRIAGLDLGEYPAVVAQRVGGQRRGVDEAIQDREQEVGDRRTRHDQRRIPAHLGDREMELEVEPTPLAEILEMVLLRFEVLVQRGDVGFVGSLGCQAGQLGLDRQQRLVQVVEGHIAPAQRGGDLAMSRILVLAPDHHDLWAGPFDQAALLQHTQCLADRRPADAGLLGELGLRWQSFALAQDALVDARA